MELVGFFELKKYFKQLPTSYDGMLEFFFIRELIAHKQNQLTKGCSAAKPLVITDSLLIELFNQLPKELQQELIEKKYVTFTRQTYKPITTTTNNNKYQWIIVGESHEQTINPTNHKHILCDCNLCNGNQA